MSMPKGTSGRVPSQSGNRLYFSGMYKRISVGLSDCDNSDASVGLISWNLEGIDERVTIVGARNVCLWKSSMPDGTRMLVEPSFRSSYQLSHLGVSGQFSKCCPLMSHWRSIGAKARPMSLTPPSSGRQRCVTPVLDMCRYCRPPSPLFAGGRDAATVIQCDADQILAGFGRSKGRVRGKRHVFERCQHMSGGQRFHRVDIQTGMPDVP